MSFASATSMSSWVRPIAKAGATTVPPSQIVVFALSAQRSSTARRSSWVTSAYVASQITASASGRAVVPETSRWSSVWKSPVYSRRVSPSSTRTCADPGMCPALRSVTSYAVPPASTANGSP